MPKRVVKNKKKSSTADASSSDNEGDPSFISPSGSSRSSLRLSKKNSASKLSTGFGKKVKVSEDPIPMTQSKKLYEAEINRLVHECAYYMLVADGKKYPIKRADIKKNLLKNQNKKEFNMVISKVRKVLKQIFGIALIEVEEKKGGYILVNADKNCKISELNEKDTAFRGLLLLILTVIWMKEGSLPEEGLWSALKVFGIDVDGKTLHPVFGDVRKYVIQELTKQLYLVYRKVNSDPPLFEFAWGARANHEVDKDEMLSFVCEVYKNEPKDWIVQFQEVQREQQK